MTGYTVDYRGFRKGRNKFDFTKEKKIKSYEKRVDYREFSENSWISLRNFKFEVWKKSSHIGILWKKTVK